MRISRYILACLLSVCCTTIWADVVSGRVSDSETGETLPFVQIYYEGTTTGTTSDLDGNFTIELLPQYKALTFQMMGYKSVSLPTRKLKEKMDVVLHPDAYLLEDVVVKPSKEKHKYRRKENPAVELIRKVIAHKDSANVRGGEPYKVQSYEKLTLALDNFNFDFNKSKFWKQFLFMQNYIDTSMFDSVPVLTIDLREELSDLYKKGKGSSLGKTYVKAQRVQGLEEVIRMESLTADLETMFKEVDIYQNNIAVMQNRFVSPLSSSLAVSYYQYYIQDTLMMDGVECIDLAFVPVNSESYSFTGHLYIVNDSTYKLKSYTMAVPKRINLNFVSDFSIHQSYAQLTDGTWIPEKQDLFAKFYVLSKKRQLYAHQARIYNDYVIGQEADKSIFGRMSGNVMTSDSVHKYKRDDWKEMRTEPLTAKESVLDSLVTELRRVPVFTGLVRTVETCFSGYISTASDPAKSKIDIGPVFNTIHYNPLEGVRLRVGCLSTANLHPQFFFYTYAAFGCKDLRPKYNATFIYSFNKKKYHPYEPMRHALYLSGQYDVEVPGQIYTMLDRDHLFMSSFLMPNTPLRQFQYVHTAKLRYQKEWPNKFSIQAWAQYQNNEAAGSLSYRRITGVQPDGSYTAVPVKTFNDYQVGVELRYAPGDFASCNRIGKEAFFNMERDAPVISLSHQFGYTDDRFFYNSTTFTAEKRFWLSSFGHIDLRLQGGIQWNKVPFTKLYVPSSNQSFLLALNSFNLMQPMEFLFDKYVSLYATYYLKGWILNRIPGINRLQLREVISFSGIYGGVSKRNNPLLLSEYAVQDAANTDISTDRSIPSFPATKYENLYVFPETSRVLGNWPYMEMTVGLENIFKLIRIDYVRRLTYTEGLTGWQKNSIRLTFRFTL